jgi:two-component system, OmpR family, response regulator
MVKLHLLFAGGDTAEREIVKSSLRRDPLFVLRRCATGAGALHAAAQWRPDLMLVKPVMPDMNAQTMLSHLRQRRSTAGIPVVFAAGGLRPAECARLRALGAAGLIEEPFDRLDLAGELRRFVPVAGLLATLSEHFLQRLDADARALSAYRRQLSQADGEPAVASIGWIAHALAGAGGTYGFAGISSRSAALADVAEDCRLGRARKRQVMVALDRLLKRIRPDDRATPSSLRAVRRDGTTADRGQQGEPAPL